MLEAPRILQLLCKEVLNSHTYVRTYTQGMVSHLVSLHCINEIFDSVAVGQARHAHQPTWGGDGGGGGVETYSGGRTRWTGDTEGRGGRDGRLL